MTLGGYADKVARVNLTEGKVTYEAIPVSGVHHGRG
jgi:hypothetical protein